MSELKSDDSDDDEEDGDDADDVIGIAEKEDPAGNCTSSANPCPNGIGSSNRDCFHRLGNGEKTQYDENDCDDAGDDLGESLAEFQSNGEADLKKSGEK